MSGILVFGNGWIGNKFIERYPEARMSTVMIEKPSDLAEVLEREEPDAVLNCAGLTGTPNVDWCETHQLETAMANTWLPIMMANECAKLGIHLTHLSSGCMFYGDSPDPKGWLESDFPNPAAYYSKTKAAADFVLADLKDVAIARLRIPMDPMPSAKNSITKIASYPKVIDVKNSVTVVEDLLDVLKQLIDKRAQGVFHVVNPEPLTYRDLMKWYEEIVDPNHKNEWITEEEMVSGGLTAKKRSTNVLQNTRLAEFGIQMRPTEEAMKDLLTKYAAYLNNK
ncbi:MAG: sugar nucleotide-binding protein [Patescibacteria group bacterium]|nr:sugar nucleotide-binding protein [Patescibacteria group bacterium]